MTVTGNGRRSSKRGTMAWGAAALLLSACSALGPPPMEPLSAKKLEVAQRHWEAHGADSYHLVVRVRAPRFRAAVYDLTVAEGKLVAIERNGEGVRPADASHDDYSVSGLFDLLRKDLRLVDAGPVGQTPAVDLRARFEPETGRLVRYRRTVGASRRRVLLVEVLQYEPLVTARLSAPDEGGGGISADGARAPAGASS